MLFDFIRNQIHKILKPLKNKNTRSQKEKENIYIYVHKTLEVNTHPKTIHRRLNLTIRPQPIK
jgi:hypothetical protein